MSDVKSILVRSPNWIGDQVLAYPFFHHLRKAYPEAKITAVCVSWVKDLQFRDLVDEVYVMPTFAASGFWDKLKALHQGAAELSKRPWDLAIALPNSISSAYLLYRSKASRRRGYKVEGRGFFLNEALPWDRSPRRHRAQAYLDLLTEKPEEEIRNFWKKVSFHPERSWPDSTPVDLPAELESEPYWVLGPGATADSRRWPVDRFSELVEMIYSKRRMRAIIVGGPSEVPLGEYLRSRNPEVLLDYTGKARITELSKIFQSAKYTVCNESGLAHVASLCGSPVQIVCGAADPQRTVPIGPGLVKVKFNPIECWPCERNICALRGGEMNQCLKGIAPEDMWEEVNDGFEQQA